MRKKQGRDKRDATKAKVKAPHRRNIPKGNTAIERAKRRKQIKNALKPLQGKYVRSNESGDKIKITKDGISETAYHASKRYTSTLAAMDAPRQLRTAKKQRVDNADQTKTQVKRMRLIKKQISQSKHDGAKTKVVIGIQASGDKRLYCITSKRKSPKKKR
jgi:hypothetical protein